VSGSPWSVMSDLLPQSMVVVGGVIGALVCTSVGTSAAILTDHAEPVVPSVAATDQTHALAYDLTLDLGVTFGGSALALTLELLSPRLAPASCRWCDRDSAGNDQLNGFDAAMRDNLRWSDTAAAGSLSNVFSYGLAPLAGIGIGSLVSWYDHRLSNLPLDLLFVAEATILAVNLNQVSKLAFARERPDVHALSESERARRTVAGDNLSFYSGHTTVAFALAASAGTVSSMRGYRLAPVMWATGMSLALVSGYLRIAADRHYATDVIAGALLGSAIGIGIPYLAHPRVKRDVRWTALPVKGGGALFVSASW
jgi:membrane-associated phospholipid phosphatase